MRRGCAVPPISFVFCTTKHGQHTPRLECLHMQSNGTSVDLQHNSITLADNHWEACAGKMKQSHNNWGSAYILIQYFLSQLCRCYRVLHLQLQLPIVCLCGRLCGAPAFRQAQSSEECGEMWVETNRCNHQTYMDLTFAA